MKSKKEKIIIILLCFGVVLLFNGCISSEETGADAKAKSPVKTNSSVDTTQNSEVKDLTDSAMITHHKVAPNFKSKQDTVQASIIKKSNISLHSNIKNEQPGHSVYTVQIGAYNDAAHALLRQKKAKKQFAGQPVYNNYEESTNLYRVSIGSYEDSKDASALFDSLKQKYPDEYKQCWINYIP